MHPLVCAYLNLGVGTYFAIGFGADVHPATASRIASSPSP